MTRCLDQKFRAPPDINKAGACIEDDAHRPAENAGVRLDVDDVATETIALTRTFGMVPATRNDIISPAVLDRVMVATNAFIKAGAALDPALLEGTTLVAVKRFYDAAREVPWLDPVLEGTRLRERTWRCASHVAYFALQEHQRRCKVIPAIVSAMQGMSLSLVHVHERCFPGKEFLDTAREALKHAGLPGGCLSTVYLSNMARHARHLLRATLQASNAAAVAGAIEAFARAPGSIADAVAAELRGGMDDLPGTIVRAASVQLTRRVKDRTRGRGAPAGRHRLDVLVDAILGGEASCCWQEARRSWRDALLPELESRARNIDVAAIASGAVRDVLAAMTVDEALSAMFSVRLPPRVAVAGAGSLDPARVLRDRAMASARNHAGTALWNVLAPVVEGVLDDIAKVPERHVCLPRCTRQAIALAIDDGQVYRLDITANDATGRVDAATVRFSLEPRKIHVFTLRGLDRIDALLARGFLPARGTITRKPGGGLLLHLPFEKECTVDPFPGSLDGGTSCGPARVVVGGVDLGLKHLAWQSIGECQQSGSGDGSWEPVDKAHPEIARFCIDQAQLAGRKDAWFLGKDMSPAPNLKRELIALAEQARALQRRKALLRRRYRGNHGHAWKYFMARREWQRCWRKMRHLHEEIARQVATRIVAACKYYHVQVLRFEDLSWSHHSAKRVSGAWLSAWQVHWFFSQVQARAALLARLAGIAVELVDARGTSKRCSACSTTGIRKGKTFSCTNDGCKKVVDSDLNAARNVRIAPISPRPRAKGEGARYRPLACPV